MITAIIIDDEAHGRLALQQLLEDYCPSVQVIGFAEDVQSGIATVQQLQAELIFLDISMPDGQGFEVLEQTRNQQYKTIFVTAHNEYAIKAFEYAAIHYLLKPINIPKLISAVERVKVSKTLSQTNLEVFKEHQNNKALERVIFPTLHETEVFYIHDISHFESNGKYAFLYLRNGQRTFINKSLAELEKLFEEQPFFRIHRSFLVHLQAIVKVKRLGKQCTLKLTNKHEIPVASRKIVAFLHQFKMLNIVTSS